MLYSNGNEQVSAETSQAETSGVSQLSQLQGPGIPPEQLPLALKSLVREEAANEQKIVVLYKEAKEKFNGIFSYYARTQLQGAEQLEIVRAECPYEPSSVAHEPLKGSTADRFSSASLNLVLDREVIEHMQETILPLITKAFGLVKAKCDAFTDLCRQKENTRERLVSTAEKLADLRNKNYHGKKDQNKIATLTLELTGDVGVLNQKYSTLIPQAYAAEKKLHENVSKIIRQLTRTIEKQEGLFDKALERPEILQQKYSRICSETAERVKLPETLPNKNLFDVALCTEELVKMEALMNFSKSSNRQERAMLHTLSTYPFDPKLMQMYKKFEHLIPLVIGLTVAPAIIEFKSKGNSFEMFELEFHAARKEAIRCYKRYPAGQEGLALPRDAYLRKLLAIDLVFIFAQNHWDAY